MTPRRRQLAQPRWVDKENSMTEDEGLAPATYPACGQGSVLIAAGAGVARSTVLPMFRFVADAAANSRVGDNVREDTMGRSAIVHRPQIALDEAAAEVAS
jgi:hypothetical protein